LNYGEGFGFNLKLSGNTLAVAAREASAATGIDGDFTDNSAVRAGAVYVFTHDQTGAWSQQAYIKASNTDEDDRFGYALDLLDDTLVVGAIYEKSASSGINEDQFDNSIDQAGAVYVFTRDGAETWSQQAYIKPSNMGAGDLFGWSVSLYADNLVVGASGEDSAAIGLDGDAMDDSASNSGAAYVYSRDGNGLWHQTGYIKASNTDANDRFGWSVALSGDTLAIGAYAEKSAATGVYGDETDNSAVGAGAVYVFQ
jgi:hypothetical protein